METKFFFVYIATNKWNYVLYTGYTSDLLRRISEHKSGKIKGFTSRYSINKLVYFEKLTDSRQARERERQIKAGSREKKLKLIWSINSKMDDLANEIASLRSQ